MFTLSKFLGKGDGGLEEGEKPFFQKGFYPYLQS